MTNREMLAALADAVDELHGGERYSDLTASARALLAAPDTTQAVVEAARVVSGSLGRIGQNALRKALAAHDAATRKEGGT